MDWLKFCRCLMIAAVLTGSPCLVVASDLQNTAFVPRYEKFEAAFTLPDQSGNPFDPGVNDVEGIFHAPDSTAVVVPAFWDGDRWRIRFAPTLIGEYRLSIERNGRPEHPENIATSSFKCVASDNAGFLHADRTIPQRFVFDRGGPYYPLGMNYAWQLHSPSYDEMFAQMHGVGMNWARVWMSFWDGKALDWAPDPKNNPQPGYLLLDAARKWDDVIDAAARNGIFVQMVLQHHGQYTNVTNPNWSSNPYNAANGGFLRNPDDFFTDPEARRLTEAKYRYIVARWGYSTHIMAFELFNEVQNIREASDHFQDVVAWHKEMAAYIRSIDVSHHMITSSNVEPGSPLSQIGLDYDQVHSYPSDIVGMFASVRTAGLPCPLFYGEWGPADADSMDAKLREPSLHNGLWASLMTPTAGAGQFWYWDTVGKGAMWPEFASATGFVRTFNLANWRDIEPVPASVATPGCTASLAFAPLLGWEPSKTNDIDLSSTGAAPDVSGVSYFNQGDYHRPFNPVPITFHLNAPKACTFKLSVGTVAAAGALIKLSVDGVLAKSLELQSTGKDRQSDAELSVPVPSGVHTVSLYNAGKDWFVLKKISVSNYAPGAAVLAKGDPRHVAFWAYSRDQFAGPIPHVLIRFSEMLPGRYDVSIWDARAGKIVRKVTATADAKGELTVTIDNLTADLAGVAVWR